MVRSVPGLRQVAEPVEDEAADGVDALRFDLDAEISSRSSRRALPLTMSRPSAMFSM